MKQEELLEAIGGIDEDFLLEAEQTCVRKKQSRILGRLGLIAAMIAALAITATAVTGMFSRPIAGGEMVSGEMVAPFSVDEEGNIIPGGVEGIKITMDVQVDADAPVWLEDIYYLEPPAPWKYDGGGSSGTRYELATWETWWDVEGRPGQLRLIQSSVDDYKAGVKGANCVDKLAGLSENIQLRMEKANLAGMEVLKLTIPKLPENSNVKDRNICNDGEIRLYWSDGRYLLQMDYPCWVTDKEAEEILETLCVRPYVAPYPEGYGMLDVDRLNGLKPALDIVAGSTGTSMANSVMGQGNFAYSDGSVYYSAPGYIYCIDVQTGAVQMNVLENKYTHPFNLIATEDYIVYQKDYETVEIIRKDGSSTETIIYQGIYSTHLYADGMRLYTNSGTEMLRRIDLQTGEIHDLLPDVNTYYVDDTYIYATQTGMGNYFLRSRKDVIDFEKIQLSFYPIKIFADGEDLYFCEGGYGRSYKLIHYRNGVETRLPICAYDYQILDGHVIYRDETDSKLLKSFNLSTGETQVLCDTLFDFSILEGRYICSLCYGGAVEIYDWQNGTCRSVTNLD